ncbi:hypothetical protein D9M71_409910 [compost metagenome]
MPVLDAELHLHARMVAGEPAQGARHQPRGGVGAGAQAQLATVEVVQLGHRAAQGAVAIQQAPCMFQHQPAMGGQADLSRATVEQGAAQAGFQGLDAATERWLAEVDRLRRAGEVAVFGEGDEMAELA